MSNFLTPQKWEKSEKPENKPLARVFYLSPWARIVILSPGHGELITAVLAV